MTKSAPQLLGMLRFHLNGAWTDDNVRHAMARLYRDRMPSFLCLCEKETELRMEIVSQHHARIKLALIDLAFDDAEALEVSVRLLFQPIRQDLADQWNFDARDIAQHHRVVDARKIRVPLPASLSAS